MSKSENIVVGDSYKFYSGNDLIRLAKIGRFSGYGDYYKHSLSIANKAPVDNDTVFVVKSCFIEYVNILGVLICRDLFEVAFEPVSSVHEPKEPSYELNLNDFFGVASRVGSRTKEQVALHMGSEVGEVNECLVQPKRGGDIIEESIDVISCALDLIYLELHKTHSKHEITKVINDKFAQKLKKWENTCK